MKNLVCYVALAVLAPAAHADLFFAAQLMSDNEVPPHSTPAFGSILVDLHSDLTTLDVMETFADLTAPATAAHIHCCAGPGVSAIVALPFTGFPSTTSGTYVHTFDLLTDLSAAFIAANGGTAALAEATFIAALENGKTYANIHDATFPGGEIRGQLTPVPEPATWGVLTGCLTAFGLLRRRYYGLR